MKKLSLEKMESIEGGVSPAEYCVCYACSVIVSNGIDPGSLDATIIGSIAYDGCMQGIM